VTPFQCPKECHTFRPTFGRKKRGFVLRHRLDARNLSFRRKEDALFFHRERKSRFVAAQRKKGMLVRSLKHGRKLGKRRKKKD